MQLVRVVAGVVERDGCWLIARRTGPPEWAGWWEFPGGKVEPDEADAAALQRELREELELEVAVGEPIVTVFRDDPARRIAITLYRCRARGSTGRCAAHSSVAWVPPHALVSYRLLPEDAWALQAL